MSSTRKILLIDYDPESIESTRRPLVRAGYEVEVASDGIAGIEAFERLKPDLVLIEPMVPKKHGFQVCQEIKSTPAGRSTPVLITTGFYRGRKHRDEARENYGCDDYLEKPIAEELLLSTCNKFLIDTQEPPIPVADPPAAPVVVVDRLPDLPIPGERERPGLQALDDLTEDEIQERLDAMIIGSPQPPAAEPSTTDTPEPAIAEAPLEQPARRVEAPMAPTSEATVGSLLSRQPERSRPPVVAPQAAVDGPARSRLPLWIGIAAGVLIVAGVAILWTLRDQGATDRSLEVASMSIGGASPAPSRAPANPFPLVTPTVPVLDVAESAEPGLAEEPGVTDEPDEVAVSLAPAALPRENPEVTPALESGTESDPVPVVTTQPVTPEPSPSSSTPEVVVAAVTAEAVSETSASAGDAIDVDESEPEPDPVAQVDPAEQAEPRTETAPPASVDPEPAIEQTPPPAAPQVPKARRGDLVDLAEVDRRPVVTDKPMPEYPPAALSMRLEGTVKMHLLIDERGRVEQVEIESGTKSKQLQRAATRAAESWVYEPGVKDGVPVKVWVPAVVNFRL